MGEEMQGETEAKEKYEYLKNEALNLANNHQKVLADESWRDYFIKLRDKRRKLAEWFLKITSLVCKKCGGACCGPQVHVRMGNDDMLIYIYFNGVTLPEPDWNFLKEKEYKKCLFLTNSGCLWKEYRPRICLKCTFCSNRDFNFLVQKHPEIEDLLKDYDSFSLKLFLLANYYLNF